MSEPQNPYKASELSEWAEMKRGFSTTKSKYWQQGAGAMKAYYEAEIKRLNLFTCQVFGMASPTERVGAGGKMSEKGEIKKLIGDYTKAPVITAKDIVPAGEGLLEESEMHLIYTKAKDYSSGLRAVRDAQAALTAGRMIEEINSLMPSNMIVLGIDTDIWKVIPQSKWKDLESRYGGKQSGSTIEKGGRG